MYQVYVTKYILTRGNYILYCSCTSHGCNKIATITKTTSIGHMLLLNQIYVTKYILTGEITSYTVVVQAMDVKK